jgi:hypothetical protein
MKRKREGGHECFFLLSVLTAMDHDKISFATKASGEEGGRKVAGGHLDWLAGGDRPGLGPMHTAVEDEDVPYVG